MPDAKIITLLLDRLHQDAGRISAGRLTILTLACEQQVSTLLNWLNAAPIM